MKWCASRATVHHAEGKVAITVIAFPGAINRLADYNYDFIANEKKLGLVGRTVNPILASGYNSMLHK